MTELQSMFAFKAIAAFVLFLFLPLVSLTYYASRRSRRRAEIERILSLLKVDPGYREAYETDKLVDYLLAVVYASLVACVGLTLLFFSGEVGLSEIPAVEIGDVEFPQRGSRLMLAMALLGAYLWGLQHVVRRYSLNDLGPSVFYGLSTRMILAAVTALVIYNAYGALSGESAAQGGVTDAIWPALAFLLGMFPQRGLRWLAARLPMVGPTGEGARQAPLEIIEGIETHDVLRLEELGIDSCYDLATADFVPLMLKTPYSARQLLDFILQAKACVHFGDALKDLRRQGVRTVVDLEPLTPEELEALATETSATRSALARAKEAVRADPAIARLREAGWLLGRFWEREEEEEAL